MEVKQVDGKWLARKNKKAKTWENITDLIHIDGDFMSVMGKAGRTTFHSYLGKSGSKWLEMYGVTSLLNYWGEKDKLVQWAVDRAVDYVLNPPDDADDIFKEARSAHKRSLEDAGSHGTDKHAVIEHWLNGVINAGKWISSGSNDPQIALFKQWAIDGKVSFLASEMPLHSKRLWTAGTVDGVCTIDGKTYIFDLKTSNYVSYKHFVQCGAYALMYEEMGHGKINGVMVIHMPRDGGFTVYKDEDVEGYKEDFKSLVRLVKRDKNKSYELYR